MKRWFQGGWVSCIGSDGQVQVSGPSSMSECQARSLLVSESATL